jgi:uncharacterized protein YlxW (UPF0749 family)
MITFVNIINSIQKVKVQFDLFYRTEILRDQGQFKMLLSKTAKLQKNMKQSQEKVDVLNEQLSKAENSLSFFKEHFEKNRQQVKNTEVDI